MRLFALLPGRLLALTAVLVLWGAAATAQLALPEPAADAAEPEISVAEALRLLAVVLDDPAARAALVEQLRAAERIAIEAPPPEEVAEPTIPELIAEQTLTLAERVSGAAIEVLRNLFDIRAFFAGLRALDPAMVAEVALAVGIVAAATLGALWLMRGTGQPLIGRADARAGAAGYAMRQIWRLSVIAGEIVAVALAWAVGHGVALVLGQGEIRLAQGLFLNAFLVTELVKIAVRGLFRPRFANLHFFAMTPHTARHWNFWLARIAGFAGYGLLFVVPASLLVAPPAFANWLRLLVVVVTMIGLILLILRNRRLVRNAMEDALARAPTDLVAAGLGAIARIWHLLAIGYVIALFVVWRTDPGNAERFILEATLYSALAILFGALIIAFMTRALGDGVRVSEKLRRGMPLLEDRLNRVVPGMVSAARMVVIAVILASLVTIWGLVDFPGWIATDTGRAVLASFGWIAGILIVAGAVWIVISSWIEFRLNPDVGRPPSPRERTLLALFSNAFVILLVLVTLMSVMSELGINIAPLLAGAGVAGLAIGFGAQKLVQDIINGAFIQFENTMNEGDVVTAGGVTGVVEKLTVRSVSLRDLSGCYHMIPFSGVDSVSNFMKGFSFHVAEMGVAYREDISEVKQLMHDAFDRLMETEHRASILPPLEMQGITEFADSAVKVRARIKTLPGQQWAVGRAYNEVIKEVFDAAGVEIPFPHRTIYMGEDKEGWSPPLNLRNIDRRSRAASAAKAEPVDFDAADITPPDRELTPPASEDV